MLSATPSSQLQVQVFTRNRNSRVTVRPSSTSKQHLMYQISGWNFSGKIRPLCADIYANQRTRRIVWNNLTLLNLIYYLFNLLSERIKIIYIKEKIVHRSCLTTIQNFIDRNTKDLFFFFYLHDNSGTVNGMFLLGRYLDITPRTMDAITAHTVALLITRYETKEGEEGRG